MDLDSTKIFSGRSNRVLAEKVASELGLEVGNASLKTFADGEIWVKFEENIRDRDIFILQSTNAPADNIIELTLMLDAASRASAKSVTAIIPYFGYARQDRKEKPRVAISSRVMMDLITTSGANRIITINLHSLQIEGFTKNPFEHISSHKVILEALEQENFNPGETVVLAPDIGSAGISQSYAIKLNCHFAIIDKRRYAPNQSEIKNLIGDLENKDVIIIDDMIDTAGTVTNAARAAMDKGARSVTLAATHAVLSGPAIERINEAPIKKIILTDTIDNKNVARLKNCKVVSVSGLIAKVIRRIDEKGAVSELSAF